MAIEYNRAGFNAAVVDYSVSPIHHPQPLLDAMAAIRFVRENAISFGSDPNKTIVLGFSAGGHLAASFGINMVMEMESIGPTEPFSLIR